MTDRLSRQRWWMAWLYCLAAVLSQGLHTHHASSQSGGRADGSSACGAAHDAPETADARPAGGAIRSSADDCPSCEFTLSHQAAMDVPDVAPEALCLAFEPLPTAADRDTSPVRPRGRAPPVA